MTIQEAESEKQKLEAFLKNKSSDGLKNIEVFIAPGNETEFQSFQKVWRNSTYVVALTTFGHCDMNVYVCDENYVSNPDQFETIEEFKKRTNPF